MRKTMLILVLFCILFSVGCGGVAGKRRSFLLDISRGAEACDSGDAGVLVVREFEVSSRFRSRGLIYRTAELVYESDYYNEFFTWPELMIGEESRDWLGQAGIFENVLKSGGEVLPDYILRGNLAELYGDFRKGKQASAVMVLGFVLVKEGTIKPEILLDKIYSVTVALESQTAESLVGGYSVCLKKILSQFENDVRQIVGSGV